MRENATIGLKEKVKRLKPPHTSRQRQSKDTDTGPPLARSRIKVLRGG